MPNKKEYKFNDGKKLLPKGSLPKEEKLSILKELVLNLSKTKNFIVNSKMEFPLEGFLVGGYSKVYVDPDMEELEELFEKANSGLYINGWIAKGTVCVDLSRRFFTEKFAAQAAKERKQLTIYDLSKNKIVNINNNWNN